MQGLGCCMTNAVYFYSIFFCTVITLKYLDSLSPYHTFSNLKKPIWLPDNAIAPDKACFLTKIY